MPEPAAGGGGLAGKRVVLATFGSLGDLHPFLALAKAIQARGGVPVVSTSAILRDRVEAQGIEFAPTRPHLEGLESDPEMFRRAMDLRTGGRFVMRDIFMAHLRDSYADLLAAVAGADLLVSHAVAFAGPLVAGVTGIRWASVTLSPIAMFSAYDPPVPPPLVWMRHLRPLGRAFWGPFLGLARLAVRGWTNEARVLRRELGLPPAGEPALEGAFAPRRVLALFSPLLGAPQPDWPGQTVQTGFAFLDDSLGAGLEPGLRRFLEDGPMPVVFTLGSSAVMDAGSFFLEGMAAARALGRRAVLLIGRDPRNVPPGPVPDSVYVADYAPYSAVFPRAAAVVHQGGVGTTGQALRSGRPMVVVPWAHDQPDNADRVRRLGVAAVVARRRFDARTAARALRRVLDDPAVADRAKEVGRRVRSEGGAAAAAEVLDRDLAT